MTRPANNPQRLPRTQLSPPHSLLQWCRLVKWIALISPGLALAANIPGLAPSLKSIAVPLPAGLVAGPRPIVVNKAKAIALGKALFWDMAVGSDGVACATCHFHAGADSRTKNQFSPGKAHEPARPTSRNAFDPIDSRGRRLANYQLTKRDFPLYRFGDPSVSSIDSVTLQSPKSYNVVASAGTFSGRFLGITAEGEEECEPLTGAALDRTFQVAGLHTRRVEPRNTPTIINAVLFDRNFWDGRASFVFNGVSAAGARDTEASVWEVADAGVLRKVRMALDNASMASVAMTPVVNEFEMSCRGRSFKDVARKLLRRRALEAQQVAVDDSVLGQRHFRHHASGKGLNATYLTLIRQAFAQRYWSVGPRREFGRPRYSRTFFSQAEANFSMFFGLAIQLYATTLVSDDSPFDRADLVVSPPLQPGETIKASSRIVDAAGALTPQQVAGLHVFVKGLCNQCHAGPLFSSATNRNTIDRLTGAGTYRPMIERQKKFFDNRIALFDVGYFNNGAVPSPFDPGLGGVDSAGRDLAFSMQYLKILAGQNPPVDEPLPFALACAFQRPFSRDFAPGELVVDPFGTAACTNPATALVPRPDIVTAEMSDPNTTRLLNGGHLFKTPQLYNVELTGPYMHNGGMATLEQAIDNYSRAGNFGFLNPDVASRNVEKGGAVAEVRFSVEDRANLAAFLKALTDDRVRFERAPFDHPQLVVSQGHPGDHRSTIVSETVPGQAADELLEIPAVGQGGSVVPLQSFEELLPDS